MESSYQLTWEQKLASKLQGKSCGDSSGQNRYGNGKYPYSGTLAGIDILNGGCAFDNKVAHCYNVLEGRLEFLNKRCAQPQTDFVLMFIIVVLLFMTMALTYLRMRKSL